MFSMASMVDGQPVNPKFWRRLWSGKPSPQDLGQEAGPGRALPGWAGEEGAPLPVQPSPNRE